MLKLLGPILVAPKLKCPAEVAPFEKLGVTCKVLALVPIKPVVLKLPVEPAGIWRLAVALELLACDVTALPVVLVAKRFLHELAVLIVPALPPALVVTKHFPIAVLLETVTLELTVVALGVKELTLVAALAPELVGAKVKLKELVVEFVVCDAALNPNMGVLKLVA